MKKLFKVKDQYFDNKVEAKKFRDEQGGVEANVFVRRGPDTLKSSPCGGVGRRRWSKS